MKKRGCLNADVQREAEKFLGYQISVTELRLIPYIQYVMANDRKLNDQKINEEEKTILKRWEKDGHLELSLTGIVVSKAFWDFMCRILWHSYVAYDGFKAIRNSVIPKGEVWETKSRKGKLLVRVLEDVNKNIDEFFQVEVLKGKAHYMSNFNQESQKLFGTGMDGTVISMRTTLTKWIRRYPELELVRKRNEET